MIKTAVEVQRDARLATAVVPWKNQADAEVPAFAVVHMRDPVDSGAAIAKKPNAAYGLFFANGPVPVAAGKMGESLLWDRPRRVLVQGSPSVGQEVGPVPGQWWMATSGAGFRVVHQGDGNLATVVQVTSGKAPPTSSGEPGCVCECTDAYDLIIEQQDPLSPPIRTVRRWSVSYPNGVDVQFGQYLVMLPPGQYLLIWKFAEGNWSLDVGDSLVVTDEEGNDVTSSAVVDGLLTLSLPLPGSQSELKLCVDFTPPTTPPGY